MTRICPKCNYVRKGTDQAPEWQCPSCQVAYNKVGAQASTSYGRYAAPAATPIRGSSNTIWIVMLIVAVLAVGLWAGKQFKRTPAISASSTAESAQPNVVLYSTEWCGYCKTTKEFFDANGVVYTELDVETTTEGREGHKKLGGNGVPLVVIGDDVIHGYDEDEMKDSLRSWLEKS